MIKKLLNKLRDLTRDEREVRVKKLHHNDVIPEYAKNGDAGLDLTATTIEIKPNGDIVYGTGLAFEIPEGYVGLVYPRSSIMKTNLTLTNSVGVIDSQYRGEVKAVFRKTSVIQGLDKYNIGDRIAQIIIVPYPKITLVSSEELTETDRDIGGFGSTGK